MPDDGDDDVWKPTRLRDVVRVVGSIDGDHDFQQFEIGRTGLRYEGHGIEFPSRELVLMPRFVHRWPTEDHEASLCIEEGP